MSSSDRKMSSNDITKKGNKKGNKREIMDNMDVSVKCAHPQEMAKNSGFARKIGKYQKHSLSPISRTRKKPRNAQG